jgi:hypothetical protein
MVKKKPQVLSQNEIHTLKDEQREIGNTLHALEKEDAGKGTPAEQIDRTKLRAEKDRLDKAIKYGTPRTIRGGDKDKLYEESKVLADKIQTGMCSKDEMVNPNKHPGCIRKHYEWEKRNKGSIERWKQIQRQLEHADPTVANIERLRR